MPIIKSAKKRVRTAAKAAVRNNRTKRVLKSALKLFGRKPATAAHRSAQSAIDTAAKKGVIHKNKAARIKKQLSRKAKLAGTKPASAKKTTTKAPAKKAATKKTAAKKTTPKKK